MTDAEKLPIEGTASEVLRAYYTRLQVFGKVLLYSGAALGVMLNVLIVPRVSRTSSVDQFLLVLLDSSLLALILRLCWIGLHRIYPCLFSYLLLYFVQITVLATMQLRSPYYTYVWVVTEGLVLCAEIFVALELLRAVLSELPNIGRVACFYLNATLLVMPVLLLSLEHWRGLLGALLVFRSCAVIELQIYFVILAVFIAYFPLSLKRNVACYSIGFSIYFLAKSVPILVPNIEGSSFVNVLTGASITCMIFWFFAFSRAGEARTAVVGHQWRSDEDQRILLRLASINARLKGTR